MYKLAITTLITFFCVSLFSCGHVGSSSEASWAMNKEFTDYWFQGKAEITSYHLDQARYGEMHQGDAVLVFVTEDFSKEKQVKLDHPSSAGSDAIKVMKLNKVKKFNTGIYPYSMMTSVFTPLNTQTHPHSLKVTTSSQEWCGQSFTQMNLSGNSYYANLYSYFEQEGDQELSMDAALLEDEIWTKIRVSPTELPNGEIDIIPGTMYQRLSHDPLKVVKAHAKLSRDGDISTYTLDYPTLNRSLTINFMTAFPHQITGWRESFRSGTGENAQTLTTTATINETLMTDYWNHNSLKDSVLRKELHLLP